MNRLGELLQPLIDAEQRSPGPAPDAVADCWDRIAAAVQRGSFLTLDVPPPASPRSPFLWLSVVILVGASLVGAVAYVSRDAAELAPAATVTTPSPSAPTPVLPSPPDPSTAGAPPDPPPVPPEEPPERAEPVAPAEPVKSTPKPRPPRVALADVEEDTFAAELRLLAQGQAALNRDDHAAALKIADQYQKTYPRGHFIEDRDALRVVALCGAASSKGATAARRFLRAYPNSIHATRIRDACALPSDSP